MPEGKKDQPEKYQKPSDDKVSKSLDGQFGERKHLSTEPRPYYPDEKIVRPPDPKKDK